MKGFDRRRSPLRTFIVERQALIAKALRSYLDLSVHIEVVGDAPALTPAELARTRPDLIFYGLDGAVHDVAQALAVARSVVPDVRMCVLSSFANPIVMEHSISSGALGFVVKDMTPSEFDAALGALASGSPYVDRRFASCSRRTPAVGGEHLAHLDSLTSRETEILRLITRGMSNREIALTLDIVEKTVKNHIGRIFSKLGVSHRTQAAVCAIKSGFVEFSPSIDLLDAS